MGSDRKRKERGKKKKKKKKKKKTRVVNETKGNFCVCTFQQERSGWLAGVKNVLLLFVCMIRCSMCITACHYDCLFQFVRWLNGLGQVVWLYDRKEEEKKTRKLVS